MLYGAPEVPGQEKEPVQRVPPSPLLGYQGGASERSTLFSLPWMKISEKQTKSKNSKTEENENENERMGGWYM